MKYLFFAFFLFCISPLSAQMFNGQDTLYGNEWINFDQQYYKIQVAEDGIYRIMGSSLLAAGIPIETIASSQYQLFKMGEEEAIFISNSSTLSNTDFIEFYGQKNRGEIDRHLFIAPDIQALNPYYSLITDSTTYFLTWNSAETGKRYAVAENDLNNLPAKEEWYWKEDIIVFSEQLVEKKYDGENLISYSSFDVCEGFGSAWSKNRTFTIERPDFAPDFGLQGEITIQFAIKKSTSDVHVLQIDLDNEVLLENGNFPSFRPQNLTYQIPEGTDSNFDLKLEGSYIQPIGGAVDDKYSVAYFKLKYPANFDFNAQTNATLHIGEILTKKYYEITNIGQSNMPNIVYDLANRLRWSSDNSGGITKVVLTTEASIQPVNIKVQQESNIQIIPTIKPTNFINYNEHTNNYFIISNAKLMVDNSPIWAYKDYRSSSLGGNYQVEVVDIDQLYQQFAYGLNQHPLSIRNFAHFLKHNGLQSSSFLLVGKALVYKSIRQENTPERRDNLVPSFGSPGSDHLLMSNNLSSVPVFPIGRIAAKNLIEIDNYLKKVKEYEAWFTKPRTFENYAWRKKLLHLRGGHTYEELQFTNYLNILKTEIESNRFSGTVIEAFSGSNDPIALSVSEIAIDAFNDGISINTLLGHGAIVNTDVGLDDPLIFDNVSKYPLMFALGCLTGNIHTFENSISERFVLVNNRGAIGYMASCGFAFPNKLINYTKEFYRLLGEEKYEGTVGEIDRLSTMKYDASQDYATKSLMEQLTYHGDPAIRINGKAQQDYVSDPSSIRTFPELIDISQDSFLLSFVVGNIGQSSQDTFALKITHFIPNGTIQESIDTIITSKAFTTHQKYLYLPKQNVEGIHKIKIDLDIHSQIEEISEDNNHLLFQDGRDYYSFIVTDKKIKLHYPTEFSIVNEPAVQLYASASDPFVFNKDFIFQIDTSQYFNSPTLLDAKIQNNEGIFSWQPTIDFQNNTVYYWRVTQDSIVGSNEGYLWSTSSFLYDTQSENGWSQSHYFQFKSGNFDQIVLEEPDRKFNFGEKENTILARAVGAPPVTNDRSRFFFNNNSIYKAPGTFGNNLSVMVVDPITGVPWENQPGGDYGSLTPGSQPKSAFSFQVDTPEGRETIANFLQNIIPDGHYIGIVTYHKENGTYLPEEWAVDSLIYGTNLFQVLEEQGATLVRQLATLGSRPYSICYQKGVDSAITETLAEADEDRAHSLLTFTNKWSEGLLKSPIIGPAEEWNNANWDFELIANTPPPETHQLDLYGINEQQQMQLLKSDLQSTVNLEDVDANLYPYLQFQLVTKDTSARRLPQLLQWQIKYQPSPDLALSPIAFHADSLLAGEKLNLELNIFNFSNQVIDSVHAYIDVINLAENQHHLHPFTVRDIPINSAIGHTFEMDTKAFSGHHQLLVELNPPERLIKESRYNNNIVQKRFLVSEDKRNPFIDITFDGKRIFNNDIISPTPEIRISLTDESPYFAITDTSSFSLKLVFQYQTKNIFFTDPAITFYPATSPSDKAIIEYRPQFDTEGYYTLQINGKDASGNQASDIFKEVNFQIILEKSISNILPYPNPFTTQTRFSYTLTGSSPPENFLLRIMTISGRIVREVTQSEFGELRIGTHLSDFVWDGTDQFGDQLANGTYLYQVLIKDNDGEDYKLRENTSVDSFFEKGIGKVVILR